MRCARAYCLSVISPESPYKCGTGFFGIHAWARRVEEFVNLNLEAAQVTDTAAAAMVEESFDKLASRSAHKPERVGEKFRSAEIA